MTWLTDAWAAVSRQECPAEILEAMEEWLGDRDVKIQVDWRAKMDREEKVRKAREKEAERERNRRCPKYTGAIERCMADAYVARGAPRRCGAPTKKVNITYKQEYRASDGTFHRALAVCATHAYDLKSYPYTGWAGEPNPHIPTIEAAAEAAALEALT